MFTYKILKAIFFFYTDAALVRIVKKLRDRKNCNSIESWTLFSARAELMERRFKKLLYARADEEVVTPSRR